MSGESGYYFTNLVSDLVYLFLVECLEIVFRLNEWRQNHLFSKQICIWKIDENEEQGNLIKNLIMFF